MSFVSDYVYFTEALVNSAASDEEAEFLASRVPGARRVLDVGCGYGRLARRLARKGYDIVGVEMNADMLALAHTLDAQEETRASYLHADMREVDIGPKADAAICWFTTFGVFEDAENQRVLESVHRNLREGAPFLIDVIDRDFILRTIQTWSVIELDDDFLIERHEFEPRLSRMHVKQTVIRNGVRRHEFSLRLYDAAGLRDALLQAGFRDVVDITPPHAIGRLQVCATR